MTKRVGQYDMGQILGEGSFGVVREVTHCQTKQKYAMKIIDKDTIKREDYIDNLKKEISILMLIDHPNIVRLYEVLASKGKIYLVLEYVVGGELYNLITQSNGIKEEQMKKYFRQIVRAVEYCKRKNICHRDLKPENILIDDYGNIKVSDFGLSSLYKDPSQQQNLLYTTCGTINYLAPEVIQNSGYIGHIADIWSLGVILFFAISGQQPFQNDNISIQLEKIVSGDYEIPKTFTQKLKDLIEGILNTNPKKRFNLEQIKQHPWFQEGITKEELNDFEQDDKNAQEIGQMTLEENLNVASNSPLSCTKGNIHFVTQKISALELIALLNGSQYEKFFDGIIIDLEQKNNKKSSQQFINQYIRIRTFTTQASLNEINQKFCEAYNLIKTPEMMPIEKLFGYPIQITRMINKKQISFSINVFQVDSQIRIIHFHRTQGGEEDFLQIYLKIYPIFETLINKGQLEKE